MQNIGGMGMDSTIAVPGSLFYPKVRPLGYTTKSSAYRFQPTGFIQGNIQNSDNVRFLITFPGGYWDPYSVYLALTVDFTGNTTIMNDTTMGYVIQVDGCAQGFFNAILIYKDGKDLERIQESDTIFQILNDLNWDPADRYQREQEGTGGLQGNNIDISATAFSQQTESTPNSGSGAMCHFNPRASPDSYGFNGGDFLAIQTCAPILCMMDFNLAPQDPYNVNSNMGMYMTSGNTGVNPTCGYSSRPPLLIQGQTSGLPGYTSNSGSNSGTQSQTSIGQGFSNPFAHNFCCTTFEPRFTNYNVLRAIIAGQIAYTNCLTQIFYFPLPSGLLGQWVPPTKYKLIPLSCMQETQMEFRMNPYAVFTSNPNVSRAYRINKFEIVAEILELDPTTTAAVESQTRGEGWIFQSVSWFIGPIYNITNGNIPGQIQINLGFSSLKMVLYCILPSDYQSNSAARKHHRLSHNITQEQLQIGSRYFPMQPVTGSGGTNRGVVNNGELYINTLKAFNRLHAVGSPHIFGVGNMAVNFRNWDPTSSVWQSGNQTYHGDANFYFENSCVGKCVYGFDLEGFNYEDLVGGINTIVERSPFCVNLQYDSTNPWPRGSALYTFCHYDMFVRISRDSGVETLGRA